MKTVVIVDDTRFMRHMLREILEQHKLKIVGEAQNGIEAIEMYEKLKPDIITLDITMPEMDGLEALKAIMEKDPNAKAIMVSAVGSKTNIMEAIKSGAKNFIVKPFNEKKVMDVINSIPG